MKVTLVVCMLLINLSVFSQNIENESIKNEIGAVFFRTETNSCFLNRRNAPLFISGIYYDRNLHSNKINWISRIEYSENVFFDDCASCDDNHEGFGTFSNFTLTTGFRYTFLKEKWQKLNPIYQISLQYSNSRYAGRFGSGMWNSVIYLDNSYNTIGFDTRVGIKLNLIDRFPISLLAGFKYGWGNEINNFIKKVTDNNIQNLSNNLIEIRIGYIF
jgi:hypothetical protein